MLNNWKYNLSSDQSKNFNVFDYDDVDNRVLDSNRGYFIIERLFCKYSRPPKVLSGTIVSIRGKNPQLLFTLAH